MLAKESNNTKSTDFPSHQKVQAGQKAYSCGQDVCCVWHSTQPVGSAPLITDFTGFNQSSVSLWHHQQPWPIGKTLLRQKPSLWDEIYLLRRVRTVLEVCATVNGRLPGMTVFGTLSLTGNLLWGFQVELALRYRVAALFWQLEMYEFAQLCGII